jgi:hypothetical protein
MKQEYDIVLERALYPDFRWGVVFSKFQDLVSKLAGKVPLAKYLAHLYKQYAKMIQSYFNQEVKNCRARQASWDASFKKGKHQQLCQ